jgi:hypothetical protein
MIFISFSVIGVRLQKLFGMMTGVIVAVLALNPKQAESFS